MRMAVHIVDDDVEVRQTLRSMLEEGEQWSVTEGAFAGLAEQLGDVRPDMVVLDLVDGADVAAGNSSFDEIRSTWFCPVVVYSAFPDKQTFDHPLVGTVTKGSESDVEVVGRLNRFVPHATMIRSVHSDFDARIREALRDSVSAMRDQVGSTGTGVDASLPRAVRRLVAARVDAGASQGDLLLAWERYIVPPLGDHLLTADLLRATDANDAGAFRIVLTPSCDLVSGQGIGDQEVLVACCEPMQRLQKVQLKAGESLSKSKKDGLRSFLTEGLAGNLVPIPEFRGRVPLMVANLKRLELIDPSTIIMDGGERDGEQEDRTYVRVASTDSPFREAVVWAYVRTTGRPGLPKMDVDAWLSDISDHFKGLGNESG